MRTITTAEVKEALARVLTWPPERQAIILNAVEMTEDENDDPVVESE